jgi:hypothetical protein
VLLPLVLIACGIDAVGAKVDEARTTPTNFEGGTAEDDASSRDDGSTGDGGNDDADAGDAGDGGDGGIPVGPLCPATAQGLVACFAFEDSATDGSPSPIVPLSAANIGYAAGHEGQAAAFTLSPKTDMRLPHASMNTTAMTIEMWIKPAALPAAGERFVLVDMDGRFGVTLQPDGTINCRSLSATTKATVGNWIHFACVNDGTTMKAYVGGQLETSVANVLGTTSDFIGIGEDSTSTGDGFVGTMDNLRIWTRGLSASEVTAAAAR